MEENIKNLVEDFFKRLTIKLDSIEAHNEERNIFLIKIKTEESGIVIGPHGKNLETIQFLLKLLISRKFEESFIVHLEVNDYLKSKEERLFSFIESKIRLVETSGKDLELPFLTAYERKKVHSYVGELGKNIYTKSEGEGAERRLHLCKKEAKLTIDIDGDDI